MMVNSLGRELPEKVGSYTVRPYGSAAAETAAPRGRTGWWASAAAGRASS